MLTALKWIMSNKDSTRFQLRTLLYGVSVAAGVFHRIRPFQTLDFNQEYFEIFRLPVDFNIDISELSEQHRELQKEVHPDRLRAVQSRKRLSMQWSA